MKHKITIDAIIVIALAAVLSPPIAAIVAYSSR